MGRKCRSIYRRDTGGIGETDAWEPITEVSLPPLYRTHKINNNERQATESQYAIPVT